MNRPGIPPCSPTVALCFAVLATFSTWLVLGDSSPFREYFIHHVSLPNLIGMLLILPYVVLIVFQPQPPFDEIIGFVMEFVQWLVIGALLGWLICRRH
jgi:hypothetical protein